MPFALMKLLQGGKTFFPLLSIRIPTEAQTIESPNLIRR